MSDQEKKLNFRPGDKIVTEKGIGEEVAALQREITAARSRGDNATADELADQVLALNQSRTKQ